MSRSIQAFFTSLAACGVVALVGCGNSQTYETRKPVTETQEAEKPLLEGVQENAEEAGAAVGEAVEDAADAVTPDRDIVDIKTPIGDVNVSEDPATGRKSVDVDAGNE